jgi:hypothetical protein
MEGSGGGGKSEFNPVTKQRNRTEQKQTNKQKQTKHNKSKNKITTKNYSD